MDRNAAIQVIVGLAMTYAEVAGGGENKETVIGVSVAALSVLGVSAEEMQHAVDTAPFISEKPAEEMSIEEMLTINFPPQA
jgi:hypothetical protein